MALRRLPGLLGELSRAGEGIGNRYYSQLAITNTGIAAGPGGRSSVSGVTATVFGCSGFVARYVVQSLARMGSQVVLPFRCDELDVQHLKPMGDLGQVVFYPDFDLRDPELIRHAISKSNVVINLVGARRPTWNFSLREVHVDIPTRIAEAVREHGGVERFMHMSSLGATEDSPSERMRTKAEGERIVRELVPHATIFKPAPIVGQEDYLSNAFARLGKRSPMCTLVDGGSALMQPVFVRDVADAMVNSLRSHQPKGKTYYLAGPEVMTVRQFVEAVYDAMREPMTAVPVPYAVAKLQGAVFDWLAKKTPPLPINPLNFGDAIAELTIDQVLPAPGTTPEPLLTLQDLGVDPVDVIAGTPFEHIRHMRAGGYDFGTTEGTQERSAPSPTGGGAVF